MERYDTHVVSVPLSTGGAIAKLTMNVANGQIQGVVFNLPTVQMVQADIGAIVVGYNQLEQIAVTNGYTWP